MHVCVCVYMPIMNLYIGFISNSFVFQGRKFWNMIRTKSNYFCFHLCSHHSHLFLFLSHTYERQLLFYFTCSCVFSQHRVLFHTQPSLFPQSALSNSCACTPDLSEAPGLPDLCNCQLSSSWNTTSRENIPLSINNCVITLMCRRGDNTVF